MQLGIRKIGSGSAAAMALAMLGGFGGSVVHVDERTEVTTPIAKQQPVERGGAKVTNPLSAIFGTGGGAYAPRRRRAGYGWTNKHAQRVAAKKRNVRRHRAATRG